VTRATKLRAWAEQLYASHAPAIANLIGAEEIPRITVFVSRTGHGAAWTDRDRVFLSAGWFAQHPDDVGGCLHEFTHAIMRAPVYDETSSWLIEGIADFVRDALGFDAPWTRAYYEPGTALAGYQTTAHFLMWLERRHPETVRGLSRRLSTGSYTETVFDELCGEPLAMLVARYEEAQPTIPDP
jgi:hypothetical protein